MTAVTILAVTASSQFAQARLARRLGGADAVVIGLSSMIGAGVFIAFTPAARVAGSWLLAGLAIAAVVAYCNATSSARLAARYPASGGTYVSGRERLGPFWGYLAGWAFVVGKTASCAAMALTFAAYAAPGYERPAAVAAVAAVLALTALNWRGVHKSALVTRIIVAVVLAGLAAVVLASLTAPASSFENVLPAGSVPLLGVLQAAGLLFFAFAGYARIATLGEEVRDPERAIPRAIALALAITLVVYAAVGAAVLAVLGPARLAAAPAALVEAVTVAGYAWLAPAIRVAAAVAALGSFISLPSATLSGGSPLAQCGHSGRHGRRGCASGCPGTWRWRRRLGPTRCGLRKGLRSP